MAAQSSGLPCARRCRGLHERTDSNTSPVTRYQAGLDSTNGVKSQLVKARVH